jgi:hypothetical protein
MGNSPIFLTITHITLSTKRFRRYGILMIDSLLNSAPGQISGQNGSSISGLGLAKTLEVLNTVSEGNSRNFLMV